MTLRNSCIAIALFVSGALAGRLFFHSHPENIFSRVDRDRRDTEQWEFINPLLDCAEIQNINNGAVVKVRDKVQAYVQEQEKQGGGVENISVYFRDLNNGPWFGLDEKKDFYPASLLKVPLMMALYKQSMTDPALLQKRMTFTGGSLNKEYFKGEKELQNGQTYTTDEIIGYMIKYSDNNASHLLTNAVSLDALRDSYIDLGAAVPDKPDYVISVRSYASFFRVLYNSTFLSKELSEKALRLLYETSFNEGISAGVPRHIKVAHKFGERQIDIATKQLHDCGIVYYPNNPYILCVMTSGKEYPQLATTIKKISEIVYEGVAADVNSR